MAYFSPEKSFFGNYYVPAFCVYPLLGQTFLSSLLSQSRKKIRKEEEIKKKKSRKIRRKNEVFLEKEEKRGEKCAFQGQKEKKKDLVHYESEQGL